ncbi:hypothetical protein [Chitinophaga sp. sic0106]|uniref:hypothetical protein n=1 Tax=Chitinophaga sp. sic0106 TaxID=2854785 RepID=UPI001C438D70|nr:hypothetical protein [Chitinophaga sp. sic0106]MBV7530363.1 hypothetical protein [Chitinophaga sp. sic0106]
MEKPFVNDVFEQLHARYPALHAAVAQNFITGDVIRREAIDADHHSILSLSNGLMQLFGAVSYLKMRGLLLSFAGMVLRMDGYIKIGELWMDHAGDELLVMPGQEPVYYYSTRHQAVRLLSPQVEEFVERILVPFIAGDS